MTESLLAEYPTEAEPGEPGVEGEDTASEITRPYDPSKIRVATLAPTVSNLIRRIEHGELDLMPEFQRVPGIWTERTQSRLIESILMGIPLPAFYFDATDPDHWLVVDGLQRLTALSRFMLVAEHLEKLQLKPLYLQDLEFLKELEEHNFHQLQRRYQRQIEEAQLTSYVIEEGTPEELKFNVFRRINTGGLPLSPQEIRHALNQGEAARMLKNLAESEEFRLATDCGISGKRMADRECVLRFLAFSMVPPEEYEDGDFDFFLSEQMKQLNQMNEVQRENFSERFKRSMRAAYDLFGNDAFRKRFKHGSPRSFINKALFEAWSVNLDQLGDGKLEILRWKKKVLVGLFIDLMNNRDFERAVSQGTGDVKKVHLRFFEIRRIIEEAIQCPP